MASNITRRRFLKGIAGLQLGVFASRLDPGALLVRSPRAARPDGGDRGPSGAVARAQADAVPLGVFLAVGADETVTVTVPRPDMGQGPRTSLAMTLAEELEVDWTAVRVRQAPAGEQYGDQTSGGSTSTRVHHAGMLLAGATARVMLIRAAAAAWGVEPGACRAASGAVTHPASGRSLTYGQLAQAAAAVPVPPRSEVSLKSVADYGLVGRPTPRIDNPDLVSGRAVFGSDVRLPGMKVAVLARPPAFGARLASFDESAALAVDGVRQVVRLGSGVAVVADHTWAALAGRDALAAAWEPGPNAGVDDAVVRERLQAALGRLPEAPAGAAVVLDALYEVPYLAHATMEPMNCVADARADRCEVWAPTQAPMPVRSAVAGRLRLAPSAVTVHVVLSGGGFGRRLQSDYAVEAAELSRAIGAPVQVFWTRDDDMRHDYYRPASLHALRGALDAQGRVLMYAHRAALARPGGDLAGAGGDAPWPAGVAGPEQERPPYDLPGVSVEQGNAALPLPTGPWRSVNNTQYTFANEAFLDELAVAAGRDPAEFRRAHVTGARLRAVLDRAVEASGWGGPLPPGHGRGVACFVGYGSYAAQVVELSVSPAGAVRVQRVTCAVDLGVAVNPSTIAAQMEGATVDGLSTALKAGIHVQAGGVVESSFVDYPWLLMDEMPVVEVHVIPSTASPGGLGEVGFPAVSPAVCNAIFAATGRRLRRLPVQVADLAGWTPEVGTPTPPATAEPTVEPTTEPTAEPTAEPGPSPTAAPTAEPAHTIHLPDARRA